MTAPRTTNTMVRNSASRPAMPMTIPFVEREIGDLVLVGVGRPKRELRQVGGAQLRHIGDGGTRIERHPEHVGGGVVL